jgi:hypothetical protein
MPTEPDPTAPDPPPRVTAGEIAEFLRDLARHHPPSRDGDPASHAALLGRKADLFARIADQHAHTDPVHAEQARQAAERARTATRHADNGDTHDTTDVNDLTSPSTPRWGISLSNTAEFRRARHQRPSTTSSSRATPPVRRVRSTIPVTNAVGLVAR